MMKGGHPDCLPHHLLVVFHTVAQLAAASPRYFNVPAGL
jgi:hypothetical protein